jgi:hypothetical protein
MYRRIPVLVLVNGDEERLAETELLKGHSDGKTPAI